MNTQALDPVPDFKTLPAARRELYYGGGWHAPLSREFTEVLNPATGESLGTVAWAGAADVDRTVTTAYTGFRLWRDTTPLERATRMKQAAATIRRHAGELARLETADSGIPHKRIAPDIEAGALAFEYFAGLATELKGATILVGAQPELHDARAARCHRTHQCFQPSLSVRDSTRGGRFGRGQCGDPEAR